MAPENGLEMEKPHKTLLLLGDRPKMNHLKSIRITTLFAVLFALTLGIVGSGSAQNGTSVTMAQLTIAKVDAHIGNRWVPLLNEERVVTLYARKSDEIMLTFRKVPAGKCTQIRLLVTGAVATDSNGKRHVVIPRGVGTTVKLNAKATLTGHDVVGVTLNADVSKSFVLRGNGTYQMRPLLPASLKILSGSISGTVSQKTLSQTLTVKATFTAGIGLPIGTEVKGSFISRNTFQIEALMPGTWIVTVSDPYGSRLQTVTIKGVRVCANANTDIGIVVIPS
jgi:Domain of unknown function (DUF4382)